LDSPVEGSRSEEGEENERTKFKAHRLSFYLFNSIMAEERDIFEVDARTLKWETTLFGAPPYLDLGQKHCKERTDHTLSFY